MKTAKHVLAVGFVLGSLASSHLFATDIATYQIMHANIGRASAKVQQLRGVGGGGGGGGQVNPFPGGAGPVNPFPGGAGPVNPFPGGGGGFQPINPNNPWGNESDLEQPDYANFNENDFLSGSTLARAGTALINAGQAADAMLANLQSGNFSNAVGFFGRACSQLGIARLTVSTANFQAGQPPLGILAQWGADFRDAIDAITAARSSGSAPCP